MAQYNKKIQTLITDNMDTWISLLADMEDSKESDMIRELINYGIAHRLQCMKNQPFRKYPLSSVDSVIKAYHEGTEDHLPTAGNPTGVPTPPAVGTLKKK
jgi:hypothetical protein